MSLRETQDFFYRLMIDDSLLEEMKQNTTASIGKFFREKSDQEAICSYPLERYQTYREHISVGLLGQLSSAFPVLHSILENQEWQMLTELFFKSGLAKSPIARSAFFEFANFLKSYQGPLLKKYPYLHELADYEINDLELFFAKDCFFEKTPEPSFENLKQLRALINPHHIFRKYQWPVHYLSKSHSEPSSLKKASYPLCLYRHPSELNVRFIESNEEFYELFNMLKDGTSLEKTIFDIYHKLYPDSENPSEEFISEFFQTLGQLKQMGLIISYQNF